MQTLKDVSEGIEPFPFLSYQRALWDKLNQGGFKQGEMTLYSAGRRSGKSMLNAYYGKINSINLCNEILLPMKPAPKYKFSRAKWYEAKVPRDQQAAFAWCVKQFGPEPTNTDAWSRWYFNVNRTFRFRDAKDYEWFLLRWGT